MARIQYQKRSADPWADLELEDILDLLSQYLLRSGLGFQDSEDRLEDLRRALAQALQQAGRLTLEDLEALERGAPGSARLREELERLVQRLVDNGFLSPGNPSPAPRGRQRIPQGYALTQRGLDFLGVRSLRRLLGPVGRGLAGQHLTDRLDAGVEAGAPPKRYEFGDALNLDAAATLRASLERRGRPGDWELEEQDLQVQQSDHLGRCATVLLLDTSHSMILYGEDRFTPAKQVALALTALIRSIYPSDRLALVLFHDRAEELPLHRLAAAQVGPYHTNTMEGLRQARLILGRSRHEMRQILLITDGKPSAMTLPDGRIYKNSFGLDPAILSATFREVMRCRRSGIAIHTFMLARDPMLLGFVRRLAQLARGKAYLTSAADLGRAVLHDFLNRRSQTVH
ncbi:MAG TPA: VWA domain-containing protein [Acidobacteriota bacterium]